MHIKYTNKQMMDVQKAWLYLLNRYYAYKVYKQIDGCTKSLAIFTKPFTMHIKYTTTKVYKQIDGCTKSLAIFTKPLLCI